MSNEKEMTALYQKMYDEQNKFRDRLLEQPQEEVLNRACEYATREDILMAVGKSGCRGQIDLPSHISRLAE